MNLGRFAKVLGFLGWLFLTATKHPQKRHTNMNQAELNISAGGFFCQGNVKIGCTSETEAPPSFKGTFFGG